MKNVISTIKSGLQNFRNDESGVTAIEYAVIAAVLAGALVAAIGGDSGLGKAIETSFNDIKTEITK
ncbi:Uncharacterised protein [BD1-7 clade bacterium]|uniref:Flp/Fap pilin component n=1 Tax=BD1-7 clade bacterium TaxID=2029982 RepID=A0A5S9N7J3_9GAMM|nr:Uncharacterised protein [BD1-7 clade bacterium]